MKFTLPVVSTFVLVLIVLASGCTGDIMSKVGVGDFGVTPIPTAIVDSVTPDAEYNDCMKTCSLIIGQDAADCARTCCTARCPENVPGGAGICIEKCMNGVLRVSPTSTGTPVTGTITPKVTTADDGCSSTTGCNVYQQCMNSCIEKHGVNCETRCCSSRCFDLPVDEKKACADECLTKMS